MGGVEIQQGGSYGYVAWQKKPTKQKANSSIRSAEEKRREEERKVSEEERRH